MKAELPASKLRLAVSSVEVSMSEGAAGEFANRPITDERLLSRFLGQVYLLRPRENLAAGRLDHDS